MPTSGSSWATTSTRRTWCARRASAGSTRRRIATRWSRRSATSGSSCQISYDDFIRTTEPRHRARRAGAVRRRARSRRHLQGLLRGLLLRSRARRSSRRRTSSTASARSTRRGRDWIEEKNYFFGCRRIGSRCCAHIEAHPEFVQPEIRRNEILRSGRGRARGHLGLARGSDLGHPAAVRSEAASSTSGSTR